MLPRRLSARLNHLPDVVHSSVSPPRSRHGRTAESDGGRESIRKTIHPKAGPVFGLYSPLHTPEPPAPSRNRLAAIFSRHPAFSSPNGVDARTSRVDQKAAEDSPQHRSPRRSGTPARATLISGS